MERLKEQNIYTMLHILFKNIITVNQGKSFSDRIKTHKVIKTESEYDDYQIWQQCHENSLNNISGIYWKSHFPPFAAFSLHFKTRLCEQFKGQENFSLLRV